VNLVVPNDLAVPLTPLCYPGNTFCLQRLEPPRSLFFFFFSFFFFKERAAVNQTDIGTVSMAILWDTLEEWDAARMGFPKRLDVTLN
jgi:hypothetical protein